MSESPEGPRRETIAASPDPLVDRGRKRKSDSIDTLAGLVFVVIAFAFLGVCVSAGISLRKIYSPNVGSCDNDAKSVVNKTPMNALVFTVGGISVSRLPACTDWTLCTGFLLTAVVLKTPCRPFLLGFSCPLGLRFTCGVPEGGCSAYAVAGFLWVFQPRFSRQLYNNLSLSRDLLMLWF